MFRVLARHHGVITRRQNESVSSSLVFLIGETIMHQKAVLPAFRAVFAITAAALNLSVGQWRERVPDPRLRRGVPACQIRLPVLK